ncbi:MAG: nucleotide sugar dehydrogenase [Gammaproteobacteria bacterium]|nr:nucleotide sugar dehydrogenase [Gammaproteobacteria bacterium]
MHELSPTTSVGVIGLGYVGLPLALTLSKHYSVRGYDLSQDRIDSLRLGKDHTGEVEDSDFERNTKLYFTSELEEMRGCDVHVVTVPTPIDTTNNPDLSLLLLATKSVGRILERGCVVIFESTVYPGVTEEICIPELESESKLKVNRDFWVGYSPERINPGDRTHRLTDVVKVTAGSSEQCAEFVDRFYRSFVIAGTHMAPSIRVAEAAKVIENIQRDINIALMNEFSQLFNKLDLDTADVLAAASTKWNFLPFKPGLVGGHCIGVDPYYLTHKAREVGFDPEVILAGRKVNNAMPRFVAGRIHHLLELAGMNVDNASALVLGVTYKQNCPDTRNSKSIELVRELRKTSMRVDVCDPIADTRQESFPCDIQLNEWPLQGSYDVLILAVAHDAFISAPNKMLQDCCSKNAVVYDITHKLPRILITERL